MVINNNAGGLWWGDNSTLAASDSNIISYGVISGGITTLNNSKCNLHLCFRIVILQIKAFFSAGSILAVNQLNAVGGYIETGRLYIGNGTITNVNVINSGLFSIGNIVSYSMYSFFFVLYYLSLRERVTRDEVMLFFCPCLFFFFLL
jgi:hypothetical protein